MNQNEDLSQNETNESTNYVSDLMEAYIDQNPDYYKNHIPGFLSGKRFLGFNFAAAIFTVPWLAYRKMYNFLIAYVLILFLFSVLFEILSQIGTFSDSMTITPFTIFFILFRVAIGSSINYFYLKIAKTKALKIAAKSNVGNNLIETISLAGGTSSLSCTLAMILLFCVGYILKMG